VTRALRWRRATTNRRLQAVKADNSDPFTLIQYSDPELLTPPVSGQAIKSQADGEQFAKECTSKSALLQLLILRHYMMFAELEIH
jgi:hypothetical protein